MANPTELAITGTYAAALSIFTICAVARWIRKPDAQEPLPVHEAVADESPYETPASVPLPPPIQAGRVPVWFYSPLDLLGAAFVFLVFAGMVLATFQMPKPDMTKVSAGIMLVNVGFQFFMAGMVTLMVVFRVNVVTWLGLRWRGWPWVLLIAPGVVFFMWFFMGGLQLAGYAKWMESLGVQTEQDTVKMLKDSKDTVVLGLMAFTAVIAAPLCEEIVFRGYLYPVLKRYSGIWPATICSALVFSAAHGSLAALLPLFLLGCLLVLVYEKTGSLWASIAVHFCFNGATVAVLFAARAFNLPLDAAP